jgi:hypothetical protein
MLIDTSSEKVYSFLTFCAALAEKYSRGSSSSLRQQFHADTPDGVELSAVWKSISVLSN